MAFIWQLFQSFTWRTHLERIRWVSRLTVPMIGTYPLSTCTQELMLPNPPPHPHFRQVTAFIFGAVVVGLQQLLLHSVEWTASSLGAEPAQNRRVRLRTTVTYLRPVFMP